MAQLRTRIRITKTVDGGDLAQQIEPKMANLGRAIGTRMQRLVPKRTWALHDTISHQTERRGNRVVTTVGAGGRVQGVLVDYELNVERGTSRMAAQPYMRPAMLQSKAGDLNFAGDEPKRHGITVVTSRRTRLGR